MWEAFLDRTCHSCLGLEDCSSYCKRKNDLFSFEYSTYIHRDVISCFEYSMPNSNQASRKGTPRSNQSYYEKYKNEQKNKTKQAPVYFKVNPNVGKEKIPPYPPHCKMGEKCTCPKKYGKVETIPEKKLAVLQVTTTTPPIQFRPAKQSESILTKACKAPVVDAAFEKKNIEFSYRSYSDKTKKAKYKKKIEPPQQPPLPPPTPCPVPDAKNIYKGSQGDDNKKGTVLNKRTQSMPLYRTLLSRLSLTRWKIYKYGERGSGSYAKTESLQDFYILRQECLDNGTLFEDPEFPATDSSIYFSKKPSKHVEWKRPHELVTEPQFFVDSFSRFDIKQGELGDCWLLAATANITIHRRLFLQIVPDDQGFDDKYAGIFHFRLWQYGRWLDVVVDDRLPAHKSRLIYLHSSEENEFWSALLEKAYAKLHGSYEALEGGNTFEAMEDFTGGLAEIYEIKQNPPNLFQIMLKAYERSSLMACSIVPSPNKPEEVIKEGLVKGHAYSITRVKYVDIETPNVKGKIPLLRLRNPWGNTIEWNGAWSDSAPEWRFISEIEKESLGLTFDYDGEFWMSFKDFQQYFDQLEVCNLNPDSLTEHELISGKKKRWQISVFEGEWVRGVTAGGCRNYLQTFWRNPQYRITLTDVDEGDNEDSCTMIVALMQKNRRLLRSRGASMLSIGFVVYHLVQPDLLPKPLDMKFFKYNVMWGKCQTYVNLRELTYRFKVPPGTYCIIPSTFDPNEEGEFLLRVFTEQENVMEEHDEKIGYRKMDDKSKVEITTLPKIKEAPTRDEVVETEKVYKTFWTLAGSDGEIDWMALKQILDQSMKTELMKSQFSKDICRSMVAMLDTDRSGKLSIKEFQKLWTSLCDWKNAWTLYDTDESGTFSGFELREALNAAGYRLNNRILNVLMHRYGNKNGEISFDDFMMCAIKLKTMIDIYTTKDETDTNTALFTIEEWLECTLYS